MPAISAAEDPEPAALRCYRHADPDAILRFVGIKRGPIMAATLVGGIVAGAAIAFGIESAAFLDMFGGPDFIAQILGEQALLSLLAAGIACFGAWSRLQL